MSFSMVISILLKPAKEKQ